MNDDITSVRDVIGAEQLLLGSDWPHPEGLANPYEWVADYSGLSAAEQHELDALLDKTSAGGLDSLSRPEKDRLNELSKKLRAR